MEYTKKQLVDKVMMEETIPEEYRERVEVLVVDAVREILRTPIDLNKAKDN